MRQGVRDLPPDALREVFLFAGLTDEQRRRLAPKILRMRAPRGALLFTQGDQADGFFAIRKGAVKVYRCSEEGRESTLHVFRSGDLFGEAALFLGLAFPASAATLEQTDLWHIPKGPFFESLEQDPDFTRRILGSFALKLSDFTARIASLISESFETRLVKWMLTEFSRKAPLKEGQLHRLPFAKHGLASLLGATPESLSRALRTLADDGLIRVSGPSVALLDLEGLRARAGEEP